MKGIRKILVAVNGSLDLLREGIRLAEDEKTWITVLKVLPPYEGDLHLTGIRNIKDVMQLGGNGFAKEVQQIADETRSLIKTRLEQGKIDEKIIDVAHEERCDLIIMGKKRGGKVKNFFGGNIVEKVIAGSPCPVLYVMDEA